MNPRTVHTPHRSSPPAGRKARLQVRGGRAGFTLIELLVVIGIMGILVALSIPSITGLAGSAGRKGAVQVLLNACEQARATALEGSVQTYLGFADQHFPDPGLRYRAFIIFRDRTEDDIPAVGSPGAGEYVALTKWEPLPRTISIKWQDGIVNPSLTDLRITLTDASLPRLAPGAELPVITFTPYGTIARAPATSSQFCLYLYEGFFANGQDNFTRNAAFQQSNSGLFERISFSRFTGRARVDVTTTQP